MTDREKIYRIILEKNEEIEKLETRLSNAKLDENKLNYITENLLPILKDNMNDANKNDYAIIEQLVSVDTLEILQIIGFNFQDAIGKPLTQLCSNLILGFTKACPELEKNLLLKSQENEIAYIKLSENEEAYNRLNKIYGNNW